VDTLDFRLQLLVFELTVVTDEEQLLVPTVVLKLPKRLTGNTSEFFHLVLLNIVQRTRAMRTTSTDRVNMSIALSLEFVLLTEFLLLLFSEA